MDLDFRRAEWESRLTSPDWYMRVEDELRRLFFPVVHHDAQLKAFRHKVYELVAELLESTEEEPGIRLSKLSAIGLVRQYAFQYLADDMLGRHVRGEPVWSGHFRQGEMVFFAYHWLIRPDGAAERLLEDTAIGWHAGNWTVNTSSVGIALSGDYETSTPPYAQIEAAARIIREYYSGVARESIVGHREMAAGISCPGAYFLQGWKQMLLNLV